MPTPVFPEPPPSVPPTSLADCDAAVARLHAARQKWVDTDVPTRIALLERTIDGMLAIAEDWVAASCKAKGHARGSGGEGEEWLGGVMPTIRNLRILVDALEAGGQPKLPGLSTRPDGQKVARVFPRNLMDMALFTGFSADIWIEPGQEATQGALYREKAAGEKRPGGVALVLGAGNQASIGPMDALYKLFVDDEVVVLKMNPVNEYVGPFIEKAFRPFVEAGFLALVYGGAQVGAHLCQHPQVDSIHITGSERTHDAIVWGVGEEQARRKASGEKVIDKPITSELGCVTPIMIVPGPWSASDIAFQARHVASMVVHNASFNCNAGKVLVLPKGWDQRDAFLAAVEAALKAMPARKAYYPGAQDRYAAFLERYPQAHVLGERSGDVVPWTLIPDATAADGYALTNEAFCGVLAVVDLDAGDAGTYLQKVVPFCNDKLWGTLSCMMLIHPTSEKEHAAAFDAAVAGLRYGGVAINCWAGVVYGLVLTTWGAFPGHPLEDIGSGRGVVHNPLLLDHPQKSVVKAPFRIAPTPAWFGDHKNLPALGRKLSALEAHPSWLKVPGVAIAAFQG